MRSSGASHLSPKQSTQPKHQQQVLPSVKKDNGYIKRDLTGTKRVDVLELLIAEGCDVNQPNDLGITPIHMHTIYNHVDMVTALIKHGADPFKSSRNGQNAYQCALTRNFNELVRLFEHLKRTGH